MTNHLEWRFLPVARKQGGSACRSASAFTSLVAELDSRRACQVKQNKKTHNEEIIETQGGNYTLLKKWEAQYGSDEVESWLAHS